MITITIEQLVAAANSGALKRLFECNLALGAWKSLRHTSAACERELVAFGQKRDALMSKYHGKPMSEGNGLTFTTKEDAQAFAEEWTALMKCEISDLPGDPISIDDLLDGKLTPVDGALLKPFLRD